MWFQYIPFSDNIKKRAIRYLLQRYLGQFFEEKLTLDQLTVDLYNGTGSVSDVSLDVQALNDLGDLHNLPFEFVDGYISEMSVSIPWASLRTDSSYVEVSGMVITVQPKQRLDSETSMLESMLSSMSSSMQLAAECMQLNPPDEKETQVFEGQEMFAQFIDSILSRVKVKFVNSLIRLEHLPKGSRTGVALEIKIRHMDYCDEAGEDNDPSGETSSSAFSVNQFRFEGVSFHSDEFPAEARTFSRSLILDNKSSDSDSNAPLKYETKPILIAKLGGRQEVRLKLKKGENVQGPKVDLELNLGSLSVFLSPRQLHLLLELSRGMSAPHTQDDSNVVRCAQKPMESGDYDRVEQQLMNQLHPVTTRALHSLQGWSTAPVDDSDEEFLPLQGPSNNLTDSMFSDTTSLNASFSSSCSSYSKSNASLASGTPSHLGHYGKKKRKSHRGNTDNDVGSEESHLHVRLSSLAVVLLHDDILTVSPETGQLTTSSLQHMASVADDFFHKLGLFAASGYGKKDFEIARQIFLEACQLNHIRLLAAPVIVESDEKRVSSTTVMGAVLTAASVVLLECLVEKVASCTQPSVD